MSDPAQVVLFLVIVTLTILLVVLGIQVFFILRDLRTTIAKANKVLDNTEEITSSVSGPVSSFSSLLMGLRTGAKFANFAKRFQDEDEDKDAK